MARAPSFAGLILAVDEDGAGSTRPDRPASPWRGGPLLAAHIELLMPCTDFVLVVGGGNSRLLEPVVDAHAAFLAVNPHPELGRFHYLQVGVQEILNRGRDAAILTSVDHSPVRRETILRLRQGFEQSPSEIWAVVPEYAGKRGRPMVMGREMITAILNADPAGSLQSLEQTYAERISCIQVDDPSTVPEAESSANGLRKAQSS